jgi:hypothetical protein
MKIIGINGFKRAGKGETALAVHDLRDNVTSVAFADKLKILGARALGAQGIADELCIAMMDQAKESWVIDIFLQPPDYYDESADHTLTGRQYLQNIGNEARGLFGDTFWIDHVLPNPVKYPSTQSALNHMRSVMYPHTDILCVTDVRYENEAQRIVDLGGVVWEVTRPGLESDGHASEQPLPRDLIDYQIRNVGDLAYLKTQVALALQETL